MTQLWIALAVLVAVFSLTVLFKLKLGINARGIRLLNQGRYQEAEQLFTAAIIKAKPGSLLHRTALVNRAAARIDSGRPDAGLEDLKEAESLLDAKASKNLRAVLGFNIAYSLVANNDLDEVPDRIAALEAIDLPALRANIHRLNILLALRRGDAAGAVAIAEQEAPQERQPRPRKFAHIVHAFALSRLPEDPDRAAQIAAILAEAKAIDAPSPTGLARQWPELATFLERHTIA